MTLSELAEIIRSNRYRFADEYDLQDGIAEALRLAEVPFEREVRVRGGRLDFLVEGMAIEVKVTCSRSSVERQVRRYIEGEEVDGVLVVAMTPKHGAIPETISGKPVEVVVLAGAGL
jgi:hypothetical protein